MLINPFFLYILSWGTTILLYSLKLSQLYLSLNTEIIVFIFFTIIISFIFGIKVSSKKIKLLPIKKNFLLRYICVYIFFGIEFFLEKKIPLVETILKTGYMYNNFQGIKTLHVIGMTYNLYITLITFYNYIITKNKKYFLFYGMGIFIYILLYLRGNIMIILFSSFLIILIIKFNIKKMIRIFLSTILVLYLFGISGNIRHHMKWNDSKMIKEIAQVNTKQGVLDPFIWSYVYITSPLANLQLNYATMEPSYDIKEYIYENLFLDTIKKRMKYEKKQENLIKPHLNVSGIYLRSYLSFGLLGMYITFFLYLFIQLFFLRISRKTNYFIIVLTILSIINIFSIFQNLYVFSGISFSLFYPFLSILIERRNTNLKRKVYLQGIEK